MPILRVFSGSLPRFSGILPRFSGILPGFSTHHTLWGCAFTPEPASYTTDGYGAYGKTIHICFYSRFFSYMETLFVVVKTIWSPGKNYSLFFMQNCFEYDNYQV